MSEMICKFLQNSLPCTLKVFYYFVIDLQLLKLIFPFVSQRMLIEFLACSCGSSGFFFSVVVDKSMF